MGYWIGVVPDRTDRQVAAVRHGRHSEKVRSAPHTAGLNDVDGTGVKQRLELLEAGEVLSGGDGGSDAPADDGQALGVPSP